MACRKKNMLYRQFIKRKSKEAEIKYKSYKNKLTTIMRNCKKEYFRKLLEDNRNNVKEMWNILNSVINNRPKSNDQPKYFIDHNKEESNMSQVVNSFNTFFANVGPDLAANIPDHRTGEIPKWTETRIQCFLAQWMSEKL